MATGQSQDTRGFSLELTTPLLSYGEIMLGGSREESMLINAPEEYIKGDKGQGRRWQLRYAAQRKEEVV